jgi:putative ABC transport system substrate-binding protein
MRRREVIAIVGGATVWPLAARAQRSALPVVGFLSSLSESTRTAEAFQRGLASSGHVDGRNISIEYRWTAHGYETLPAMAEELVRRGAQVIGAFGPPAVLAAKAAAPSTPIVFITGADPVKFGFVASFSRPGGNLTGVWLVTTALAQKRLALLREIAPQSASIVLLVNPTSPVAEPQARDAESAGQALGIKLSVANASAESEFGAVFELMAREKVHALMVSADPLFASRQEQLVALASQYRMPAIYEWREFAETGGLMSYGTVVRDGLYRGGVYAGRILGGAKAADLPVQELETLELVINLKAARELGLTIPPTLLARADGVIE